MPPNNPISIPSFYRLWFTTIDPINALLGTLINVFTPVASATMYTPTPQSPLATETICLLDSTGAYLAGIAFLQAVLLRMRPDDVAMWRAVQGSVFIVDLGLLLASARAMSANGMLDITRWRSQEWVGVGVAGGCAVLRACFMVGVGFGGRMATATKGDTKKR